MSSKFGILTKVSCFLIVQVYCPIYSKPVLFIAVTVPHILLVLYQELELEHDDDSTTVFLFYRACKSFCCLSIIGVAHFKRLW